MGIKAVQEAREITGYHRMATLTSALPVSGTGSIVMIQAEAQNVRYRADGVDPTASIGMLLQAGECHTLNMGSGQIGDIRVIGVVTGAILNVTAFK